jgi:hypothetical protein
MAIREKAVLKRAAVRTLREVWMVVRILIYAMRDQGYRVVDELPFTNVRTNESGYC